MLKLESPATSKWAQHSPRFQPRDVSAALSGSLGSVNLIQRPGLSAQPTALPMARLLWAGGSWLAFMPTLSGFLCNHLPRVSHVFSLFASVSMWFHIFVLPLCQVLRFTRTILLAFERRPPLSSVRDSMVSALSFSISRIAFRFSK